MEHELYYGEVFPTHAFTKNGGDVSLYHLYQNTVTFEPISVQVGLHAVLANNGNS
jgi:hypothetical protein